MTAATLSAGTPSRAALPAFPLRLSGTAAGIVLILASSFCFSFGDVLAKGLTSSLPPVEVAWLRYVVFAALVVPMAVAMRGRRALSAARPGLQVLRGLAAAGSAVLFIMGLSHLLMAEATAINFVSPIIITALSIPLLGERVGARRWAAAAVGFAGVLLVVQPGAGTFQAAAVLPLASALVWAFAAVTTRMMGADRPETTLAWSAITGLAALSLAVPLDWVTPAPAQLGVAVGMGVASTVGHALLVLAFQRAAASTLAPFSYVQLLFAGLLGYAFFGSVPGAWTMAGCGVIAASGLYTAHRERLRARDERAAMLLTDLASTAGRQAAAR